MQDRITYANGKQSLLKYKRQEILAAPPERLVLHLYDYIISCCAMRNCVNASRGIAELIDGLNLEYREIAMGLLRLYEYCLRQVKAGKYDEVRTIIRGLRDSWAEALAAKEGEVHKKPLSSVQGVLA